MALQTRQAQTVENISIHWAEIVYSKITFDLFTAHITQTHLRDPLEREIGRRT